MSTYSIPHNRERMMEIEYVRLMQVVCNYGHTKDWSESIRQLQYLSMNQRKGVLLLCRSQTYPTVGTTLYRLTHNVLSAHQIWQYSQIAFNPLYAGLLVSLVMAAPMTNDQVQKAYEGAIVKEMKVMESTPLPCALNFNPLFGSFDESVTPYFPPNKTQAMLVYNAICLWVEKLELSTTYPSISRKTISKDAQRKLMDSSCNEWTPVDNESITQVDLERYYYTTGVKVKGCCELRQKWYVSNLAPRTYYASGGEAFFVTKWAGKWLTKLADSLVATNRRSRVNPTRLRPEDDEEILLYDLTSFTSNLHVQRAFMFHLSTFCRGKTTIVIDAREGPMEVDIGDILWEYTTNQLTEPIYSVERVLENTPNLHHHVAGFLGVYGNIASATFIHGAVISQIVDTPDKLNVAGDDGVICKKKQEPVMLAIKTLGNLADEKVFLGDEEGAVHLKRPFYRLGNSIIQGRLVSWPSFEYLLRPGENDPRYPYLQRQSSSDRKSALGSSLLTFFSQIQGLVVDEDTKQWVYDVLTYIYDVGGLPKIGHVPQLSGQSLGFIPALIYECFDENVLEYTLCTHYNQIVELPDREKKAEPVHMYAGEVFCCNSSARLSYLETIGCLISKKLKRTWFDEAGYQLLLREYRDPLPHVYEYTVVTTLPPWYSNPVICEA